VTPHHHHDRIATGVAGCLLAFFYGKAVMAVSFAIGAYGLYDGVDRMEPAHRRARRPGHRARTQLDRRRTYSPAWM
jgi:hypothetical protein